MMILGLTIMIAWLAIVIWGEATLVIRARRGTNWTGLQTVGIAALSATTVAGPLLALMPEQVFFGVHTIGLGFLLALVSAFIIAAILLGEHLS